MKKFLFFSCIIASLAVNAQHHDYKVVKTFHIASTGGWDYLAANEGKLYVSHGTQVNILDENSGDSLGYIPNTTGVHGIAFDNHAHKGYTSNGRLNNVTVFDLNTFTILGQIATGENPDAILYEPYSNTIITCNGRSKNLSVIDVAKGTVISTVDVGGKPETAVSDGKGKLFVNIEDKSEIVAVDIKTFTVIGHWPLKPAEGPTGLAYDKITNRLFAGCDKLLAVINATTGQVMITLPIGDGCDGVAIDQKNRLVFTSNGEGNMTVVKIKDASAFETLGNFPTKRGARTITFDEKTGAVYMPTADFDPTQMQSNGRPRMIPGSFQVLVIQ
jgi:DNA-binding beta-propeller fold protein YncE